MNRIVVRQSVDMRLLSMQMYKLKNCERAMQDGEKKDQGALNLADLARLFGFLKTDEDGEIVGVLPDYDDDGGEWERGRDDDEGFDEGNGEGPSNARSGRDYGKASQYESRGGLYGGDTRYDLSTDAPEEA